jgi:acetyltransferase-like isoleucine patch superfamily enzyme
MIKFFNPYYLLWLYRLPKLPDSVRVKYNATIRNVIFGGDNVVNKGVKLVNCDIGKGSYISINSSIYNTKIGKFCSIGRNLSNSSSQHPSSIFVSTHPAFYSLNKQSGFTYTKQQLFTEHKLIDNKFQNVIGNDVWIGNNVTLMEGISIGDGAIIASGAIVTKDIPSYTIFGGIPAKHIKYRFSEKQRDFLKEFKWWNKDDNWLQDNVDLMSDIDKLIKKHG